jgi:hypothetical protein
METDKREYSGLAYLVVKIFSIHTCKEYQSIIEQTSWNVICG